MPVINLSNPFNILIALVLFALVLFLAREIKKSNVTCIMLLVYLTILVGHCIEYVSVADPTGEITTVIANCIAVDFMFILLSFIAYLWTDNMEAIDRKLKSVDDSLNWFWKKI